MAETKFGPARYDGNFEAWQSELRKHQELLKDSEVAEEFVRYHLQPPHGAVTAEEVEGLFVNKEGLKESGRVVTISRISYHLLRSLTPRGVFEWFDRPREDFDGQTPRELLDEDLDTAGTRLQEAVRGLTSGGYS